MLLCSHFLSFSKSYWEIFPNDQKKAGTVPVFFFFFFFFKKKKEGGGKKGIQKRTLSQLA